MRKLLMFMLVGAIVVSTSVPASAQTIFKSAMQDKYELRSVSCFVCHERVERGTPDPKKFRNELGKLFDKEFEGKDITAKLESVSKMDRDDENRVKVEEAVVKEFKTALEKIEKMEMEDGTTYLDAFKEAKIDGIRK